MGPIGRPETSIRIFHYSLRNNPRECSSGPFGGGSPKSPKWDVKPEVCTKCCHVSPSHDSPHSQPVTDFSPYTIQNPCKSSTVQVLQFVQVGHPPTTLVSGIFDTILRDKVIGCQIWSLWKETDWDLLLPGMWAC